MTGKATLLDLTREVDDVLREVEASGGELTAENEARLDAAGTALARKVDSMGEYLAGLAARADAMRAFARGVQDKARAVESLRERLLGYCALALGSKDRIEGEALTMKRVKNPLKLVMEDEGAVARTCPEAVILTPAPDIVIRDGAPFRRGIDKQAVKEAIKAGKDVQGARLERGERIEVK